MGILSRASVFLVVVVLSVPAAFAQSATGDRNHTNYNRTHTGSMHVGEPWTNHPGGNPGWMRSLPNISPPPNYAPVQPNPNPYGANPGMGGSAGNVPLPDDCNPVLTPSLLGNGTNMMENVGGCLVAKAVNDPTLTGRANTDGTKTDELWEAWKQKYREAIRKEFEKQKIQNRRPARVYSVGTIQKTEVFDPVPLVAQVKWEIVGPPQYQPKQLPNGKLIKYSFWVKEVKVDDVPPGRYGYDQRTIGNLQIELHNKVLKTFEIVEAAYQSRLVFPEQRQDGRFPDQERFQITNDGKAAVDYGSSSSGVATYGPYVPYEPVTPPPN